MRISTFACVARCKWMCRWLTAIDIFMKYSEWMYGRIYYRPDYGKDIDDKQSNRKNLVNEAASTKWKMVKKISICWTLRTRITSMNLYAYCWYSVLHIHQYTYAYCIYLYRWSDYYEYVMNHRILLFLVIYISTQFKTFLVANPFAKIIALGLPRLEADIPSIIINHHRK